MTDGAVNRIVALVFLGIVVAPVLVIVVEQTPRFYPGSVAVTRVTAQYDIRPDGGLDVTETIDYDYGESGRPLDRVVQLRRPDDAGLDASVDDRGTDRVWEVSDIAATDPDGNPVPLRTKELDPNLPPLTSTGIDGWDTRLSDLRIQLGERLPYLPGARRETTFILKYRVHGALDEVPAGYELNWPDPRRMTERSDLRVPIDEIRVTTPTDVSSVACSAHSPDASHAVPCTTSTTTGRTAVFAHDGGAMTVTVRSTGVEGGAEHDSSPSPRWVQVVAYAGAAVLLLVTVGVITRRKLRQRPSDAPG